MIEIKKRVKPALSMLAIDAAEEVTRFRLKENTDLTSVNKISKLIKKIPKNLNYQLIFSKAYSSVYALKPNISSRQLTQEIVSLSKKIENFSELEDKEIEQLIKFYTNLSDYAASYEERRVSLRKPCS